MRFRIVARYNGDFAMDNITITDTPVDAEIVALNGCWGSPYKMEVTVRNNDLGCANTPVINIPSGGVAVVEVGDVNLPKETTVVNVKVKRPNGLEDKFVENDEWETDATQWSNCNDHCSNVIEIGLGTTKAAETSWANYDPSEDPNFTGCVDVTLENTVWYKFTTNDSGLPIKMKVSQQVCSPELKGIQLTVLKAGTPCDPTTYEENYFCSYTENTDAFEWDAGPLEPNTTYYIAIDGVGNSSCDFYITLEGGVDKIDGIAGPDKLVCSDESVLLGIESNPSYTYTWTEVTPGTIGYLDDVHLAQPTFQYTGAPLTTPLQIKYELAVRRNGHYIGIDEMEVTVRNCLNAVNDINQTPQELLVEGNVLTNDDGEGITVSEASIEVSGIVYTLTLGTEETIPNIGHITMYADGIYTFEPTDNFAQKVPDIVYTLQDTDGDTDTAILSIQVVPEPHNEENNLPIAQNDTYTIEQTQTAYITVLANDSDLDNDALSLMEVRAHGVGNATAILNSTPQDIYDESGTNAIGVASVDSEGRIVFTPTADFIGDVPFDYVLSDGNGGTNTAQVVLAVLLSNSTDNIYTNDDAVIGKKGQIITGTVKANDKIESSQNTLTVNNIPIGGDNTVIPLPSETGTLKMNMDGTYEFVPHANFSGTVVLVYEICNDEGYCDKATLYLTTLTRIDCSFIRANIHVTRPLIK
ncbi:MAG: hypothetical protein CSB02_00290 [Bacteroidia bacterium]|nr:MAG: hypothetical protein CSB02_00290 [Bacteroidia bacterium]